MIDAAAIARAAAECRPRAGHAAVLVGISGIDASGKSTLARAVAELLTEAGIPHAHLSVDWFHTRAAERFLPPDAPQGADAGEHFYRHAFRWEELFAGLIEPLVRSGSCDTSVGVHDMASDTITPRRIACRGVRMVVLEGIFIFRRDRLPWFDLRYWIDCPFEIALERALARNQEGLPTELIRADYQRIYFLAQRHHLERDRPALAAGTVVMSHET